MFETCQAHETDPEIKKMTFKEIEQAYHDDTSFKDNFEHRRTAVVLIVQQNGDAQITKEKVGTAY